MSRRRRGDRPRLGAVPIVLIIAFLLVGTLDHALGPVGIALTHARSRGRQPSAIQ
jgi:hypothetical protein